MKGLIFDHHKLMPIYLRRNNWNCCSLWMI